MRFDKLIRRAWRMEIKLPGSSLKHDKAGSVMTRRRRSSISTDYIKSGLVSSSSSMSSESTEPVQISGNTWGDCSKPDDTPQQPAWLPRLSTLPQADARSEDASEKLVALRRCDRNRHHIADIGKRCPLQGQRGTDGCRGRPRHDEIMVERKVIKCEVHHALNRIFDRYETTIDLTRRDCVEHVGDGSHRKFTVREVVLSAKRLLGEGTEWAKERDAQSRAVVAWRTIRRSHVRKARFDPRHGTM